MQETNLTPLEQKALGLRLQGHNSKSAATVLEMSGQGVKQIWARAMKKLTLEQHDRYMAALEKENAPRVTVRPLQLSLCRNT